MLVLTRGLDKSIIIGDPKKPDECIEVFVVEVKGDQVRIGVQAPRSIAVDRMEVWEDKQREKNSGEKRAAGTNSPPALPARK